MPGDRPSPRDSTAREAAAATTVDGYGVEPQEVSAVLASLVGEREPSDSDEQWYAHLTSRQALLSAAHQAVTAERAALVADLVAASSERAVAARLGLSPARPGQLARRARDTTAGRPRTTATDTTEKD